MDECIIFDGFRDRDGYGRVMRNGRPHGAHRLAYEAAFGPIPAGRVVRHTCDNPGCINPRHLMLGTQRDNVADRQARGRQAKGERNGRAKLTEAQVLLIRRDRAGGESIRDLATRYNVNKYVVADIVHGRTWRSLLIP